MPTIDRKRLKHVVLFVMGAAMAAGTAFTLTRWLGGQVNSYEGNEITWLQQEFKLSPAQVEAVRRLHEDYKPVCQEHCRKIQQVRSELRSAPASATAQAELARVEAVCQEATREHLRQVAAVMDSAEGERFLALVMPKLAGQRHEAPLLLR